MRCAGCSACSARVPRRSTPHSRRFPTSRRSWRRRATRGSRSAPSSAVQLALYRVTQESLSNVIRHADGSSVDIALRALDDELVLTVRNTRPSTPRGSADHGGHGIRGMIERMASVDGSLAHGPDPDGGYTVTARVPRRPAAGA
ncbi:sensor histidine kinase [Pseudoclavibacter chungangensis]|uniref:sensor histidine kinase n=1 Tax=Pseudoclavibacter chungangensis TaxID=587635 RepID=UPI00363C2DB9